MQGRDDAAKNQRGITGQKPFDFSSANEVQVKGGGHECPPHTGERHATRMTASRLFVLSFTLGCVTLPWLACDLGTAIPQNAAPAKTQDQREVMPLDGGKIFRNYCASCHGVSGNGDGPAAPALKTKLPQLTTLAQRNGGTFPADRVRRTIAGDDVTVAHGSREMPVWGPIFHQIDVDQDLGYVRLQNVTEYLNTIQQK
jgi:mono/diheme cytochrome c family protein